MLSSPESCKKTLILPSFIKNYNDQYLPLDFQPSIFLTLEEDGSEQSKVEHQP